MATAGDGNVARPDGRLDDPFARTVDEYERFELELVGRQEFRSGAVALRYQPRRVAA